MRSFLSAAALAAITSLPVLAEEQTTAATPELTVLCPQLDGKSLADSSGAKYSVSCDWTMEAEGKAVEVGGTTTPLICMEACEESEDCYSVNIAADGGCSLISGKETGMKSSNGSINLFRLAQATSTTSRVQITTTLGATTSSSASKPTISTTIDAIPSAAPSGCDLSHTNLCPACDDAIARDASGIAYHIYCDTSLHTNGTYSVQEYLSPEGCLKQCDDLSWCLGASYYDDRSCEIAKGPDVYPSAEIGYTAFVPVASSAPTTTALRLGSSTTLQASVRSVAANKTTSSLVPDSTVSILPISSGCNTSSLTCPECDGYSVDDKLNQTYTALCTFAPICDRTAIMTGPATQEECMQGCDQDGTCLAVLWYNNIDACHLCQQGLDGGPGAAPDFILLVADIDGDNDGRPTSATYSTTASSSSKSSVTAVPPYPTAYGTGSLLPPAPYSSGVALSTTASPSYTVYPPLPPLTTSSPSSTRVSVTVQPGGPIVNTTRSASVPDISAAVCPGLGEGVFVDPTDFNFFDVMCDSIFTAAHSRYTTASDFAACVASCTTGCDGVQFGYTSRCGLYRDISIVGPGIGWTIAASLTFPANTNMPYSTIASTTSTVTSNLRATPLVKERAAYIS